SNVNRGVVVNDTSAGNAIEGNSIAAATVGIDLKFDGVTPNDFGATINDPSDADSGPNNLQNYPVINSVTTNSGNTVIAATLRSEASKTYRIELFSNITCLASGFGGGRFLVATTGVNTDASGNANINFTVPTASITGGVFTMTATDPANNTSEFSQCKSAAPPANGALQFGISSLNFQETAGTVSIAVTRTNGSAGAVSVNYATGGGTATPGQDYTAKSGKLDFADGETAKTISIDILDDSVSEPTEDFNITLSSPTGGATLGAQKTIDIIIGDNDTPTVSINDIQVAEGNSGTTNATFTVSLNRPSYKVTSVDFATDSSGTATPGVDFQPVSGTVTFAIGETSKPVTVLVNGDTTQEPNETFVVKLSNNVGVVQGVLTGTGTIIDDDTPTVSINDVQVTEGNSGTTSATFTVSLNRPSFKVTSVDFATDTSGTATPGVDFQPVSGTVTFAIGETSKPVTVLVNGDTTHEPNETFGVKLSNNVGVLPGAFSGTGTIIDDDTPTVSINDIQVAEGNSGTTNATFTVSLDRPAFKVVSVDFATDSSGTATPGVDFQPVNGTVTFAIGETSKPVTVLVNGDAIEEPNETFAVKLSNNVGVLPGIFSGTGTIIDDDAPATTVQFSQANYNVQEDQTSVAVTVTRSGDLTGVTKVDYATNDKTASQRTDYTIALGTLTFAAGETSKTFQVLINEDSYIEGLEQFEINLTGPTGGAALGTPATTTISINDDAQEPLTNAIDDAQTFVSQHYHDFLNREPDQAGLNFWTNQITSCGADQSCVADKRNNVSAAFFLSIEFQQTGFLVERLYRESYGTMPGTPVPLTFNELINDSRAISQGVVVNQAGWQQQLAANQQALVTAFVQRPRFVNAFPTSLTPAQFVDALFSNAGVLPPAAERQVAIDRFAGAGKTVDVGGRTAALLDVAQSASFVQAETNHAFVLMQYFGYLRRNPNDAPESGLNFDGYSFWLNKLNQFGGNYVEAEMVRSFIVSLEYRQRFGQ
ncbi:MAG TPA: Calx-beta domain-containing protein, partial [Pyrinomonadaceae bacterium]|nr:Calx-beta domain-containing protein [Pyrinomonadaceae bacterium]